ncbi:host attachment protein [Halomonas sp. PR-M31]|uniref:baeRF12 domain-containing protein n=1 Tax=Halomonas sp. PR-M31 TaxID=1471202 RepID=UPI000651C82C|nr:host attachment family protein [Halomonas sp. PR-M31]
MTTYIVVSDAARARVFAHAAGNTQEIDNLVHPESREHTGDLRTGGEGAATSGSGQQHQTGDDDATSEKHAMFFAKEVADYLKNARSQGKADNFVIAAAPQFLGHLREKMDSNTRDMVIKEIDKDYSKASVEEITEKLAKPYAK